MFFIYLFIDEIQCVNWGGSVFVSLLLLLVAVVVFGEKFGLSWPSLGNFPSFCNSAISAAAKKLLKN